MKATLFITIFAIFAVPAFAGDADVAARIEKAMLGEHRSESNRERNQYRHPVGTLTFLGLEDGMTVVEIWPGGGWYTEVLAPAIRHHGQFIVAGYDPDIPDQPDYRYRLARELMEKFENAPELYDQVAVLPFSPPVAGKLGEDGSVDMILTFRNAHGWIGDGIAGEMFAEFARALKPGGILGVVQHRAGEEADPAAYGGNGYVSEKMIVDLARDAGLYLEARSEVNANPKDSHDHPAGVWTLPPSLNACDEIEDEAERAACEAPWIEIGESDRMTLRFRKPIM